MEIRLSQVSHRFGREKIFSNLNLHIKPASKWSLIGENGSGKSTLLRICASALEPYEGAVSYSNNEVAIPEETRHKHLAICTPYMSLIKDFTAEEMISFYQKFKPLKVNSKECIEILKLEKHRRKAIKTYSSGMQQRLKLGLAILSDSPLLFLDEPLSNLDAVNAKWYQGLMEKYAMEKTIVIASNQNKDEYFCCSEQLNIQDFK